MSLGIRLTTVALGALFLGAPAPAGAAPPAPPMLLPGDARAATAVVRTDPATWIVGARPGPPARAVARRFAAERIGPARSGAYVVARAGARAFAAALRARRALVFAEPNRLSRSLQGVPDDPLSVPPNDWRAQVVDPALTPPAVTDDGPLIALVDAELDATHPEFEGGRVSTLGGPGVTNSHGTGTAAVAAAPANGRGILGVWPGARALNLPLPDEITCARSANRIFRAVGKGASVINMSYGSQAPCYAEYESLQFAVARGAVPVAAAGNEFAEGNPLEFPASLPHVLTVASVGRDLSSSYFSNASAAVDLSAPGEDILTAVPPSLDGDGTPDGYEAMSGTSFSAPMVAAAVAWVQAARPELSGDQVGQVVRLSARDLGNPGWDGDTGFGLLSVGAALQRAAPPRDPTEPNDDMIWIDGRAFSRPDEPIFDGRHRRRFFATLDRYEDPADVYRVRVRPRSRARVSVKPRFGDPELAGFRGRARSLAAHPLAHSHRRGGRTERIALRNRSGRRRTFYVAVAVQSTRSLDAGYTLTVRR